MNKIFCLCGKSSTGKDTIYKRLLEKEELGLLTIVPYTTRPIRAKEVNGREYFFTDEAGFAAWESSGRIIEHRAYETVHGLWRYFTADDGQIAAGADYLVIGTIEAYLSLRDYFGADRVVPILITLDDGERLQRALQRERKQKDPKYEEMCRRFLADSMDFSAEKIAKAGIEVAFENDDLERCLSAVSSYILAHMGKEDVK